MKRAGIIFFIIIILLTGMIRIASLLQPVKSEDGLKKSLWIKKGNSSRIIVKKLAEKNLIKSRFLFNIIVSVTGKDDQLKAGYYEIPPSKNTWEIISILTEGRIATFKFTIPEGYTVREIVSNLADNTFYNEKQFIAAARDDYNRSYLPSPKSRVKYPLEGFLFPNTYIIPREAKPRQIFNIFLNQFEKTWLNKLNNIQDTTNNNYSIYEIVTIASLIEDEAKLDSEKELISAVIHNRLDKGMYLQIDAGIQYCLPERKERILYEDLEIESPYNTYINSGLPGGPICNPGDKAIKAALEPAKVDYLFYFALSDGSHKFTRSYKKHLELQKKINSKNKEDK